MTDQIQLRRGTSSQGFTDNPTLAQGEPAVETDTGRLCVGDGSTNWRTLPTIYTRNVLIQSGATTLNDHYKICVYTGTTTHDWTLPIVADSVGMEINVLNRGTATMTLKPGGSDSIWAGGSGAVSSFAVLATKYYRLICDGFFWLVCA